MKSTRIASCIDPGDLPFCMMLWSVLCSVAGFILQKERDKDESVHSNMQQYGKGSHYLDVVVADASLPLWHPSLKLDCIITDRKLRDMQTVEHGPWTSYNLCRCLTGCIKKSRMLTGTEAHDTIELCHLGLHSSFDHEYVILKVSYSLLTHSFPLLVCTSWTLPWGDVDETCELIVDSDC